MQEAKSLLSKWNDEMRPIHCIGLTDEIRMKILGRIETIAPDKLIFSQRKTNISLGEKTFMEIPFNQVRKLEYSDPKDVKELAISNMKGHDALLTITYQSGTQVGFDVLATTEEIAQL